MTSPGLYASRADNIVSTCGWGGAAWDCCATGGMLLPAHVIGVGLPGTALQQGWMLRPAHVIGVGLPGTAV